MEKKKLTATEDKKLIKESLIQAIALSRITKDQSEKNYFARQASALEKRLAECTFKKDCPCCNGA
jgi:hypothetical protein